jgi:alkanesulfonate monooxygenase SsuD/methylene tetrahydromethanopterin reductase-like flavin-dependent oxidoreductase (luciferase family)
MKFGLFNLMSVRDNPGGPAGVIDDTRAMIGLAEDVGFDVAWFAEHHFTNYSISPSPLMMAAHFAGAFKTIKVGAAVVVLPLYHPMRVAQEIALADQLSGGRLVLGVGTGYQAYEFERLGADVARKTDIFLEYWAIVASALMTGEAEFQGEFITLPHSVFTLRPVQTPLPPLYVTSIDPRVLRALAPLGAIPFITAGWKGSPALPAMAANARDTWRAAGLGDRPMPLAIQQYVHVTDSRAEALEAAERARFVARMVAALRLPDLDLQGSHLDPPPLAGEPGLDVFRDNLIIGDAHYVAERLVAEFRAFSPVHYNGFFQFGDMPIRRALRSLERFGAEVLPLIEAELGPLDAFAATGHALEAAHG